MGEPAEPLSTEKEAPATSQPASAAGAEAADGRRRGLRKHGLPIAVGLVLGLALLAGLRWFGVGAPQARPRRELPPGPHPAEMSQLGLDLSVPEAALPAAPLPRVELVGPPIIAAEPTASCDADGDGKADDGLDCFLRHTGSAWQVQLGLSPGQPLGELPAVARPQALAARVGDRIRTGVGSAAQGLLAFFIVEPDGGVLMIYPSPDGTVPVLDAGVVELVPRPGDLGALDWAAPGHRRLVAVVTTVPTAIAGGEAVGNALTYFAPGATAEALWRALDEQAAADRQSGEGLWSIGVLEVEVASAPEPPSAAQGAQ